MASIPKTRDAPTLDEFLSRPDIDRRPYPEYIDGRVIPKPPSQKQHSSLTRSFSDRLNQFAESAGLGEAFPELRCTYEGRSILPDVVFLLEEHIDVTPEGRPVDETPLPPDIHIEIISPKQGVAEADEKLRHSTAHGCPLGWLVHPDLQTIDEYRPGQEPRRLTDDGVLDGVPVLPDFRLPVAEVWRWLGRRRRRDRGGPA